MLPGAARWWPVFRAVICGALFFGALLTQVVLLPSPQDARVYPELRARLRAPAGVHLDRGQVNLKTRARNEQGGTKAVAVSTRAIQAVLDNQEKEKPFR